MKKLDFVGIDVGAKSLVVALERGGKIRTAEFANDPVGHRKLCRFLARKGRTAHVCLEATGIYHLDAALALHRTPGLEVSVLNPAATRDFGRALLQRSKTDRTDAVVLLEYARRLPFEPWIPPEQPILDLQAISRRLTALTGIQTQEKNRLHAAGARAELTAVVAADIQAHLTQLQQHLERLRKEALDLIGSSPPLKRLFQRLVSVRGIATLSAIRILAELAVLPHDMSARQWVAHAGLDPRHVESGSSIHKPARISKKGNKHLRAALFMPALVAIRQEPHVRAFYEKTLQNGKKPIQAVVAVMRKLLHAIHGMFRTDTDFQGERFYAPTP
jgi:transposase